LNRPASLPRRPLTLGELLDAAVELVRSKAAPMLIPAALLATGEQLLLYPLRSWLNVDLIDGPSGSFGQAFGSLLLLFIIGCAIEAALIALIGVNLGRAVAADLTGTRLSPGGLLRPSPGHLWALLLAPLMGAGYVIFGLAGAVIGLERRGPFGALGRSASLSVRSGLRAIRVRLPGYLAWLLLRLAFWLGLLELLSFAEFEAPWDFLVISAGLILANASAYVFLAALDAVTIAEVRFRTEGLDIWLSRAEQFSTLTPQSLAAKPSAAKSPVGKP
jgi:hypothetical protein